MGYQILARLRRLTLSSIGPHSTAPMGTPVGTPMGTPGIAPVGTLVGIPGTAPVGTLQHTRQLGTLFCMGAGVHRTQGSQRTGQPSLEPKRTAGSKARGRPSPHQEPSGRRERVPGGLQREPRRLGWR